MEGWDHDTAMIAKNMTDEFFAEFDKNKDGKLDKNEFKDLMASSQIPFEGNFDEKFSELDAEGNGVIEYQEMMMFIYEAIHSLHDD